MSLLVAIGMVLAPAPAAVAATPPTEEKLVCKYQEGADLGSHIARRKRVCMRASDWKDLEVLNEQRARRMQERGAGEMRTDKSASGPGG